MSKDLGSTKKSDMQDHPVKPGSLRPVNVRKSDRMHGTSRPSQQRKRDFT